MKTKKYYQKPTSEVFQIHVQRPLAGSDDPSGGEQQGGQSRSVDFDDE
jgi:hypothetical protein